MDSIYQTRADCAHGRSVSPYLAVSVMSRWGGHRPDRGPVPGGGMRVKELLERKDGHVVTVSPRADIARAVQLLLDHRIGALPVVDDVGGLD
jgi:CBS domain-containing protein